MKWSECIHNQDYKEHKRNSHAIPSSSPMYQAFARISEGSAESKVSEPSLRPHPLSGRNNISRIKNQDPALTTSRVVCEILCSCGQKYIGETKRALETRLKEHEAAMRRGETEKSEVAEHV